MTSGGTTSTRLLLTPLSHEMKVTSSLNSHHSYQTRLENKESIEVFSLGLEIFLYYIG